MKANLFEAEFLGFMPWIIIQRVTLPLAVFFHFHSAVVFIELFKEVYDDNEQEEEDGEGEEGDKGDDDKSDEGATRAEGGEVRMGKRIR